LATLTGKKNENWGRKKFHDEEQGERLAVIPPSKPEPGLFTKKKKKRK